MFSLTDVFKPIKVMKIDFLPLTSSPCFITPAALPKGKKNEQLHYLWSNIAGKHYGVSKPKTGVKK